MSYNAKPIFFLNSSNPLPIINRFIKNFLENYWLTFHNYEDNLYLYHYTTLQGLKGIFQNRSLWFSHISTLNDPSELKYGQNIATDVLKSFVGKESDKIIKQILEDLINYVNVYDSVLYQTFIACLCEEDNLLSQWRGYASKGGGYSIGFNFNDETKFSHNIEDLNDTSYIILRKVIYSSKTQKEILQRYISGIIESAKKSIENHKENSFDVGLWATQVSMNASNLLFDVIFTFKNEAFKEEKEWRLIKAMSADHNPDLLKFREIDDSLIPYLETYIYNVSDDRFVFPISSLKFGPMLDPISSRSSLELYLNNQSSYEKEIKLISRNIKIDGAGYALRA